MKQITIISGKGGTGKTTVAVNLFHYISKDYSHIVQLMDCDVEEPKDHIFLKPTFTKKETSFLSLGLRLNLSRVLDL